MLTVKMHQFIWCIFFVGILYLVPPERQLKTTLTPFNSRDFDLLAYNV